MCCPFGVAWQGGQSIHTSPSAHVADCGSLLQSAGFSLPTVDQDTVRVGYPNAFVLMEHLQVRAAVDHLMGSDMPPQKSPVVMTVVADVSCHHLLRGGGGGDLEQRFCFCSLWVSEGCGRHRFSTFSHAQGAGDENKVQIKYHRLFLNAARFLVLRLFSSSVVVIPPRSRYLRRSDCSPEFDVLVVTFLSPPLFPAATCFLLSRVCRGWGSQTRL